MKSILPQISILTSNLMKLRHLIVALLVQAVLAASLHSTTIDIPAKLRTDGKKETLAASSTPLFTWQIGTPLRGETPLFNQVIIASSQEKLAQGEGDLWDSGKTAITALPGIRYDGAPLPAGTHGFWKVRWWNDIREIPSPWSKPASFEVAPSSPADWNGAVWMDDGKENPTKEEDFYKPDPAPLMREEFLVSKPITKARLHVAGLGLCLPSINGETISDQIFDPAWTNFDKRILFRTHDVTSHLKEGANCLGLSLGNGWYNPLPLRMWGRRNIRGSLPVGRPRVIASLVIDHPDGSSTIVKTGPAWTTGTGGTIRDSIYLGEERDARLEIEGWDTAGFDDSTWSPVNVTGDSLEQLIALHMPPVRKKEVITAKSVKTLEPALHIVDFGENFTGIPEIKITAPAGTKITFRFGELLHDDGTLNFLTSTAGQIKGMRKDAQGHEVPKGGPGAPVTAWQQDVYITNGKGIETFVPRFTFHGFRYMEIAGLKKPPEASDFRAFPLRTDLPNAGSFSSSNEGLNQIQEMCRRTFLANVMTVQSDCPHRERFSYGGDIVATSEAYMMNFDMSGFYAKTVRDWGDATRPDGRLTDTAPFVGIDYCGVGWAMVHPLLIEQLYQHYGNKTLMEEQLPLAVRWLDVVAAGRKESLVIGGLGDHEALIGSKGPEFLTPMFIDTAKRIARLSKILGNEEDAERFNQMAAESIAAWKAEYFDEATGKIGKGHQSAQCFALGFNAAPADIQEAIFNQLVADLTAPEDSPRLTTGIYGTHILLEQLSQNGRSDLAYGLANREAFPSWKWMMTNGATTLWEHWAKEENTYSHNHPMFGSISNWFFRWLGGIQCAPDAVGFDKIIIRPQIISDLEWVNTSHQSIRGKIISNWKSFSGTREFEIVIPSGANATVELPIIQGTTLTEGGKPLSDHNEINILETQPELLILELGSGAYRFTTE